MPIKIDYSWDETQDTVSISCDVKRSLLSLLDVYVSDCLVKLNCPPYFLQLDLKDTVKDEDAKIVKGTFVSACVKRNVFRLLGIADLFLTIAAPHFPSSLF